MTALQGCVSFDAPNADLARVGIGLAPRGRQAPAVWSDRRASLAAVEPLSRAEARGSSQPLRDNAGRILVFDGFLLAPREIARTLGLDAGTPDAILAASWLTRHGPEALAQLRGDYTLARWDPAACTLAIAVAPMAGRVMYWYASGGTLWFATTLADLFRLPGVPRIPSPLHLAAYTSGLVLDPSATLFRDVRLLPPGRLLIATASAVREEILWRPDPTRRLKLAHDDDYVEAARELLDRAVGAQLQATASPAFTLTGGLDSSAVATTAARLLYPGPVRTYTAVPPPDMTVEPQPGFYADERGPVSEIAALHPNIEPRFCHSDGPSGLEQDPTPLFLASGRPCLVMNHVGWFDPLYRAVRDDGHGVLMIDMAGNFGLSYDGLQGFGDLMRRGRLDLVARHFHRVARFQHKRLADWAPGLLVSPLLPAAWRGLRRRWRKEPPEWLDLSPIRPDFAAEVGLAEHIAAAGTTGIMPRDLDSRVVQAHFLDHNRLLSLETRVAIRAHYGLDLRDPLADLDLVDFCLAIPREQYFIDGRDRSLARRVLADRLPPSVVNEHRIGQQKPEWYARVTPQREAYAAELQRLERIPLAAALLDLPRLKSLIEDWPADAAAARARRFTYESLVPRAVQIGRFLRWVDGSNY